MLCAGWLNTPCVYFEMCNRRRFSFVNEITKGALTSGDKYSGEVFRGFTFRSNCLNLSYWCCYVAFVTTFSLVTFTIMSLCPYIKFTFVSLCSILLNVYNSLFKFRSLFINQSNIYFEFTSIEIFFKKSVCYLPYICIYRHLHYDLM